MLGSWVKKQSHQFGAYCGLPTPHRPHLQGPREIAPGPFRKGRGAVGSSPSCPPGDGYGSVSPWDWDPQSPQNFLCGTEMWQRQRETEPPKIQEPLLWFLKSKLLAGVGWELQNLPNREGAPSMGCPARQRDPRSWHSVNTQLLRPPIRAPWLPVVWGWGSGSPLSPKLSDGGGCVRRTDRQHRGRAISAFRILVHFLLKKRIKHLQIYFSHVYFKGDAGGLLQNWGTNRQEPFPHPRAPHPSPLDDQHVEGWELPSSRGQRAPRCVARGWPTAQHSAAQRAGGASGEVGRVSGPCTPRNK